MASSFQKPEFDSPSETPTGPHDLLATSASDPAMFRESISVLILIQ